MTRPRSWRVAPPPIDTLDLERSGGDLVLSWTPGAGTADGYRLFRSAVASCGLFDIVYKGTESQLTLAAVLPATMAELYWIAAYEGQALGVPSEPIYVHAMELQAGTNALAMPSRLGVSIVTAEDLCADLGALTSVTDLDPVSGAEVSYVCGAGSGDFALTPGRAMLVTAAAPTTVTLWGHGHPTATIELLTVAGPGAVGTYRVALPFDHTRARLSELEVDLPDAVELTVWDPGLAAFVGLTRSSPSDPWTGPDVVLSQIRPASLQIRVDSPSTLTPDHACGRPAVEPDTGDVLLVRRGRDVEMVWTPDLLATGWEIRRTDRASLPTLPSAPVHIDEAAPASLPLTDGGAVSAAGSFYYQVAGRTGPPPCTPGIDTDDDRLEDCVETDTGLFVSSGDTGSDPLDPDTDGDGLEDGDEVLGTLALVDLPAMGADPLRRDVFIEYDWFDDDIDCGDHSHFPTQAMRDRVSAAFADAPLLNPDGSTGIVLHHDVGQGGAFEGGNLAVDADGVIDGGVNGAEFKSHKLANFDSARMGSFYYCLLPHRYNTSSGSSGQAEINGNDFIVSLYCSFSTRNVANTIMHEIGHNFGLRHGGFENCNYKPNYNSVMNYIYQFPGVDEDCDYPGDGLLDYSRGTRITLDESDLDENLGTCGTVPYDWDDDRRIEASVSEDINPSGESSCGGRLTVLQDSADWDRVSFGGLRSGDGAPALIEVVDCNPNPPPG